MSLNPVFEEWSSFAQRRSLIPRDIDVDALIRWSKLKIVSLTGIRRSGKSSILMLLAQELKGQGQNVSYVNIEDQRVRFQDDAWDQLLAWFGDQEGWLLLDEITSKAGWEAFLSRVHELYKDRIHIISSSSRAGLSSPPRELRGRTINVEVFPLSFSEYLRFRGEAVTRTPQGLAKLTSEAERYMVMGGFPEAVLSDDEMMSTSILSSYYRDIAALDMVQATGYEIDEIELLGRYLLRSPYFSASRCLAFLKGIGFKTSKDKLLKVERWAQASYLFLFTEIFSKSVKDRIQYPRKCYAGDTGFFHAISDDQGRGRSFENQIFLSVRRYLKTGQDLAYWKDRQGREVDIVLRQGDRVLLAVQACYDMNDDRTMKREIDAIVRCSKELGAERAVIVTHGEERLVTEDGVTVDIVPMAPWLLSYDGTTSA
jgi:predicted AAA+ superfamily ATPase